MFVWGLMDMHDQDMLPKLFPNENQFGEPVNAHIPAEVEGILDVRSSDRAIWAKAKAF